LTYNAVHIRWVWLSSWRKIRGILDYESCHIRKKLKKIYIGKMARLWRRRGWKGDVLSAWRTRWKGEWHEIEGKLKYLMSNLVFNACGICVLIECVVYVTLIFIFWNYIFNWLGWNSTDWWDEEVENFLSFNSIVKGSKMNKVSHLFLLSTYWYLVKKKHCMERKEKGKNQIYYL